MLPPAKPMAREAGQADGADAGAAVLQAHDLAALLEGDAQAHPRGLRVEPGMRLGRQLAQRARLALAQAGSRR